MVGGFDGRDLARGAFVTHGHDHQALGARANRRGDWRIEAQAAVAVVVVTELSRRKQQRNGGGSQHVVGGDALERANAPLVARVFDVRAGCAFGEDRSPARHHVQRRHHHGAHDAGVHVAVHAVPIDGATHQHLHRARVEQRFAQHRRLGPTPERVRQGHEAERAHARVVVEA